MKTPPPFRIFSAIFIVMAFYFAMYPNKFEALKVRLINCDSLDIIWFIFGLFSGLLTVYLSNKLERQD